MKTCSNVSEVSLLRNMFSERWLVCLRVYYLRVEEPSEPETVGSSTEAPGGELCVSIQQVREPEPDSCTSP